MDENKIPDNIIQFPIRDKGSLMQKLKEEIELLKTDIADRKLRLKEEEESLAYQKEQNPDYNFSAFEPGITLQKNELARLEGQLDEKIEQKKKLMEDK